MNKSFKNILQNTFLITMMMGIICLPSLSLAECNGKVPNCSDGDKCIAQKKNGYFTQNSGSYIKAGCLKKATAGGCFDSVPVDHYGSYNTLGYRPKGAGGNPTPRNHYGSDIGMGGATGVPVRAATDGVVKFYDPKAGGSGRTLVVEHKKKCSGAAGGAAYHTIYRHLFKVKKQSGQVQKGEQIGIVGGSNYSRGKNLFCDNPAQVKGQSRCNRMGQYYAIHLHLEVVNGPFSSTSTSVSNKTIIEPYCGDLQTYCGGCSVAKEADQCNTCKTGGKCSSTVNGGGTRTNATQEEASKEEKSNCELGEYLDSKTCVFCGLFKIIFNAASVMAKTASDNLVDPCKTLVGIGFGIWLAVYFLKKIALFQSVAPGDIIKDILFQGFRVAIAVAILGGALYEVMDLTLNPVMQTGLNFANSLNSNSNCTDNADYMQNIMGYDSANGYQKGSTGGLSAELGKSIICSIKNLEDSVGVLLALGNYSMCLSWNDYVLFYILPHLGYLLSGAFLWLVGVVLLFSFPWCLIDCILQLCIAAALIPCAVAAFAFKITSKYIKILWQFFMNAMFNVVFFAFIVFIINEILKAEIKYSITDGVNDQIFVQATGNGLAWWGVGALKIFMVCFFMWCFFDEAKDMANRFAQGGSLGGSKGIGRMIGGTVAQAGKATGGVALAAGKKAASAVGESANSFFGNRVRSQVNKFKGKALTMLGGKKITDEKGNVVGYKSSFNILGFKQTREVTKDENGLWTQTKETHQRSKAEKAFVPMKDADGNITYGYVTRNALGKQTGIETMNRRVDKETGNIIYETADGNARVVTDKNGVMLSYKRRKDRKSRQAVMHGGVTKVNDSFMRSKIIKNDRGEVIGVDTEFANTSAKYLQNKDGTTNMHAFKEMMQGAQNKELAAAAIVGIHMNSRGQQLSNRFKKRDVKIEKDGTIYITQVNNDGSVQKIQAKMVGNQMIIKNQTVKANGDIVIQKSNGIQNKTTSYTKQEDGHFFEITRYSFSDHAHRQSRITKPLNAKGEFGYGIDSTAAMRGFSEKDLETHAEQIRTGAFAQRVLSAATIKSILDKHKDDGNIEEILAAAEELHKTPEQVEQERIEQEQEKSKEQTNQKQSSSSSSSDERKFVSDRLTKEALNKLNRYLNRVEEIPKEEIGSIFSMLNMLEDSPEKNELRELLISAQRNKNTK